MKLAALLAAAVLLAAAPARAQISDFEIRGSVWVGTAGSARPLYAFASDGTYTFSPGDGGRYISHSGTWDLVDNGRRLMLHATSRVERVRGRERMMGSNRTFTLPIADIGDGLIRIDGRRFTRG